MSVSVLPSRRLLLAAAALGGAALALLAFPGAALLLAAADLALTLFAVADWLLTPGPACLRAEREAPERLSVLSPRAVTVRVRNGSAAALAVTVRDEVPPSFRAAPEELTASVPARGEARLCYEVRPAARGRFEWGGLRLRYRSLLGLWERVARVPAEKAVRVYPAVGDLEKYELLARTDELPGGHATRVRGVNWEFEALREFVNGDDVRLMDWKATARRQKLIVRQQRAERNQSVIVLVDSGRLMTAEEGGVSKLDHAVNAALLLAHVGLTRGDRVGLCTFSHQVHGWVAPRPRLGQLRLIAEALYDLRGDFSESDHARCLRQLALRHGKRALLVVLTDFVDADTAADMVAAVAHAARRHVVLFAAFNDPFVGRAARLRPRDERDGFRKAVALGLLRERREVLERLRLLGAQVIDAEPGSLTPALLNKYLEITLRGLL